MLPKSYCKIYFNSVISSLNSTAHIESTNVGSRYLAISFLMTDGLSFTEERKNNDNEKVYEYNIEFYIFVDMYLCFKLMFLSHKSTYYNYKSDHCYFGRPVKKIGPLQREELLILTHGLC